MNSGANDRHLDGAPLTAESWRREFVARLRLHNVVGTEVGDAVAEVEAHCADSGQNPGDAFGDPATYADTVAASRASGTFRPTGMFWGRTKYLRLAARTVGILGGVFAIQAGSAGLSGGRSAAVTAGELLGVVLGTTAMALAVARLDWLRRWWRGWPAMVGVIAAVALPRSLWQRAVLHLPAGWLLCGGIAVLAVALWPSGRSLLVDRIIDPRTTAGPRTTADFRKATDPRKAAEQGTPSRRRLVFAVAVIVCIALIAATSGAATGGLPG
jgi:hypothetical protein